MTDTTHLDPEDGRRPERSGGGAQAASVDYELAKRTGRTLVNPGPQVSGDEAAAIVADLRAAAASAVAPVAETSALTAPAGAPDPLVVDLGYGASGVPRRRPSRRRRTGGTPCGCRSATWWNAVWWRRARS